MKIKKLILMLIVVTIFLAIIFGINIHLISERLYEKYVSNGDKWICNDPKIELTYYTDKEIKANTYCDITLAKIEGIDEEIKISNVDGHSKNWNFFYMNNDSESILSGEYEVKDENTLVIHVFDDSPSIIAEPGSDLIFKKVKSKN